MKKTKDWDLVQNAALVMKINMLKLGLVSWPNLIQSNLTYSEQIKLFLTQPNLS